MAGFSGFSCHGILFNEDSGACSQSEIGVDGRKPSISVQNCTLSSPSQSSTKVAQSELQARIATPGSRYMGGWADLSRVKLRDLPNALDLPERRRDARRISRPQANFPSDKFDT